MALIKCVDCGKEISDRAEACMHCGCPIKDSLPREASLADAGHGLTEINGIMIDVIDILHSNNGKKIDSVKELCARTGVGIVEGKAIIDKVASESKVTASNDTRPLGFWAKAQLKAIENEKQKQAEKNAEKERITQMDKDGVPYCPKCKSASLSANKKGFGVGKAVAGAMLTGGLGLMAGNINAKKVRLTCMKCGHQFWAGKK